MLVPSSATPQHRNHRYGGSGNLALLLHTPLDPLSFLTKSLVFLFFSFFLFFWCYREERVDSEKEQCGQIHQLQPHQRGGAEPASCRAPAWKAAGRCLYLGGISALTDDGRAPQPPYLPKSSALSASPLRLRTNYLVTVTTVGSHEPLRDAAFTHPSTKHTQRCMCILHGILRGRHQANALGLGAWRKLQIAVESWSRRKPARLGIISFTQLPGKAIRREQVGCRKSKLANPCSARGRSWC